jgi:hypothetical protein
VRFVGSRDDRIFVEDGMIDFIKEKWLKITRVTNFILLICAVIIAVSVDGNGRIFGLGEKTSYVVGFSFFCPGILLSSILTIGDKMYRIAAVITLIVYLILGPWWTISPI